MLGLGIIFFPYFCSWFTLRKGHSLRVKIISFCWLSIVFVAIINSEKRATDKSKYVDKIKKVKEASYVKKSCSLVSHMFGSRSRMSNVQKDQKWKDYKGKPFKWDLKVVEVSDAIIGGGYNVQFKCRGSNSFISDIIVKYPSTDKDFILKLEKGSFYKIKGMLVSYSSLVGLSAKAI